MIEPHLGETIDIHGGGLDLIFPHHENEIAQSRCAHGGSAARALLGAQRLRRHGRGEDVEVARQYRDAGGAAGAGARGETLRLALLSAHYRSAAAVDRRARRAGEEQTSTSSIASAGDADAGDQRRGGDRGASGRPQYAACALTRRCGPRRPLRRCKGSAALLGLASRAATGRLVQGRRGRGWRSKPASPSAPKPRKTAISRPPIVSATSSSAEGIVLEDGPGGTTWRKE